MTSKAVHLNHLRDKAKGISAQNLPKVSIASLNMRYTSLEDPWGLGGWGVGCGVYFEALSLTARVQGLGFKVYFQVPGFRVQGAGSRVHGSEFRVQGVGFRDWDRGRGRRVRVALLLLRILPGVRTPKHETRNRNHGYRKPKHQSRITNHESRKPKAETRNPKPSRTVQGYLANKKPLPRRTLQ